MLTPKQYERKKFYFRAPAKIGPEESADLLRDNPKQWQALMKIQDMEANREDWRIRREVGEKIGDATVNLIRFLYAQRIPVQRIANVLGMNYSSIRSIALGANYTTVSYDEPISLPRLPTGPKVYTLTVYSDTCNVIDESGREVLFGLDKAVAKQAAQLALEKMLGSKDVFSLDVCELQKDEPNPEFASPLEPARADNAT